MGNFVRGARIKTYREPQSARIVVFLVNMELKWVCFAKGKSPRLLQRSFQAAKHFDLQCTASKRKARPTSSMSSEYGFKVVHKSKAPAMNGSYPIERESGDSNLP